MHLQNFRAILFITVYTVIQSSVYAEFCPHWDNCDIFTQSPFSSVKEKNPTDTVNTCLSH